MRKIFIAIGIGVTAWFILSHQPIWLIVMSIVLDTFEILNFIEDKCNATNA